MAKCGHDICPDDSCGWKHPFNKDRRENCRRVQQCFEDSCSGLKALGPSGIVLYDACLGHCHRKATNPNYPGAYDSVNAYLCNNFDPVTLVDYFGVNVCGVPEDQTGLGKKQQAADESNSQTRAALIVIAILIVVLLIVWLL